MMLWFIAFAIALLYALWQGYKSTQTENVSPFEKTVLTRQLLIIIVPSLLCLSGWVHPIAEIIFVKRIVGVLFFGIIGITLGYVGINILRHRISVIAFRGQSPPVRGEWAVINGAVICIMASGAFFSSILTLLLQK
jgi:hypothetical protein